MNLPSLYAITEEIALLLESDDDVTEQLDALMPTLENKAANVAHWVEYQNDLVETLKRREESIRDQRKRLEARAERFKDYLKKCLQQAEIMKITDARTGTEISLKKNPPKVVVDDSEKIPNELWRVPDPPPPAPDLRAIGEKLKRDEEVPGCHLEHGWRVEIKG